MLLWFHLQVKDILPPTIAAPTAADPMAETAIETWGIAVAAVAAPTC